MIIKVRRKNVLNFIFLQCSEAEKKTAYSKYKNICYRLQNHIRMTILIICIYALNRKKKTLSMVKAEKQSPCASELKYYKHF